ncbi:hypothetical protein [Herbaspirillum sp.]|uniref:hypothetical protein n=1 Tax=Herbaspirillum sp. TaxID=1890675 RepID=UPI002586539B|nr:hypothetical protein [Herbaspirillum sp.]MCP3949447.1 hypothetical protein [Herbaspirillum sp.]MCP4222075.1 hypothetical protein [Actinomycetes bacterium]
MKLVIVYDIPDDIDPRLADPHEIADALTDLTYRGRFIHEDDYVEPTFVSAEWEDNAKLDQMLGNTSLLHMTDLFPEHRQIHYGPMPDTDGGADYSLVELVNAKPSCKTHGAMNKVTPTPPGYWRCLTDGHCRAGCQEIQ